MIVEYECFECGYKSEVQEHDRKVTCPGCGTVNDVWLTSEEPPEKHRGDK